jgi:hypothetical protein
MTTAPIVTEIDIRSQVATQKLGEFRAAMLAAGVASDQVDRAFAENNTTYLKLAASTDLVARARLAFEAAERRAGAALDAGKISTEQFGSILEGAANKQAAAIARTNAFGAAVEDVANKTTMASARANAYGSAVGGATTGTRNLSQVAGQAGFQLQDFAVQVQGGTSALVALSQQGSQFLGIFGPGGAIAGAVLAFGAIGIGLLKWKTEAQEAADATTKLDEAVKAAGDSIDRQIRLGRELVDLQDKEIDRTADLARYYASLSDTLLDYERVRLRVQRTEIEDRRQKASLAVDTAVGQFRPLDRMSSNSARLNEFRRQFGSAELDGPTNALGDISAALKQFYAEAERTPEVLSRLYVSLSAVRDSGSEFSDELKSALEGLVGPIEQSIKLQEEIKRLDAAFAQTNLPRDTLAAQSTDTTKAREDAERSRVSEQRAAERASVDAARDAARQASEAAKEADRIERERLKTEEKIARLQQQSAVEAERQRQAENKREQDFEDYLTLLEREAELAGQTKEIRREELELMEARKKAGRDLTDIEEARVRDSVRTKDANEKMRKDAEETSKFIDKSFDRALDRVGDSLTDVAVKGGKAFNDLGTVAAGVAASIYADFLKLSLANPLRNLAQRGFDSVGSFFGDLLGGGQAAGGPIDAATGLVGLTGIGFGGPRAAGGPVDPGKWYLVGEEGPERFVPNTPGYIVPANDTAAMLEASPGRYSSGASGGGGNVVVNIYDNRSSRDTAPASVSERRGSDGSRQIDVLIEDKIDAALAGGRFDPSMQSRYGARKTVKRT